MTGLAETLLPLQALVFAGWVFLMYRWLFGLRRRAVLDSGRPFPGLPSTLRAIRAWWADPAARGERRLLIIVTLVLVGMILAIAWLAGAWARTGAPDA